MSNFPCFACYQVSVATTAVLPTDSQRLQIHITAEVAVVSSIFAMTETPKKVLESICPKHRRLIRELEKTFLEMEKEGE